MINSQSIRGIFITVATGLASLFAAQETAAEEQAVIVHFYNYGSMDDLSRLFDLQHQLEAAIEKANAGFLDGHEIAVSGSDGYYYMYGPDAEALLDAVLPLLKGTDFTRDADITVRYGPPEDGVRERQLNVGG